MNQQNVQSETKWYDLERGDRREPAEDIIAMDNVDAWGSEFKHMLRYFRV